MQSSTDMQAKWLAEFERRKTIWRLVPDMPLHVKTSMAGEHVEAYFNSDRITAYPDVIGQIVEAVLVPAVRSRQLTVDWVVSYAPYGLPVALACSQHLGAAFGYTLPDKEYATTFEVPRGAKVLVVCDDIYSGIGVARTIATLESMGADVVPLVFCLANLHGEADLSGRQIVAAVGLPNRRYAEPDCPLCEQGSEAVLPRPNWVRLAGDVL